MREEYTYLMVFNGNNVAPRLPEEVNAWGQKKPTHDNQECQC